MSAQHICGHCGRVDQLEHCTDYMLCLACGGRTSYEGEALPREPEFTVPSTQPPQEGQDG